MILKVAGCSKGPVILVVFGGGPIDMTQEKNSDCISLSFSLSSLSFILFLSFSFLIYLPLWLICVAVGAILWAGYPGQSGGTALAKIIFGDVSPSGRLSHTTYPANYVNQVPESGIITIINHSIFIISFVDYY